MFAFETKDREGKVRTYRICQVGKGVVFTKESDYCGNNSKSYAKFFGEVGVEFPEGLKVGDVVKITDVILDKFSAGTRNHQYQGKWYESFVGNGLVLSLA